ncbi:MAG: hypothetical protein LBS77_06350 [Desulfovibrio sp.]|jgi:hypothetical protein|nr:hypothetical protein [Desulfovibrio sp.]
MAFEAVGFYATLWQGQGINWILLPENPSEPWFASLPRPQPAARTTLRPIPFAPPSTPAADGREKMTPQAPERQTEAKWTPVPQNLWPSPWRERIAAVRRGRIVWTYWELGRDLCQNSNPGRRALFQRLITDLAHPGGTYTFFPVCVPAPQDQENPAVYAPDAEIFWSALKQLGARATLIMGEAAVKALALEDELPLWGMSRRHSFFVWRLPEADAVLQDENLYSTLLDFLRTGMRDLARR